MLIIDCKITKYLLINLRIRLIILVIINTLTLENILNWGINQSYLKKSIIILNYEHSLFIITFNLVFNGIRKAYLDLNEKVALFNTIYTFCLRRPSNFIGLLFGYFTFF